MQAHVCRGHREHRLDALNGFTSSTVRQTWCEPQLLPLYWLCVALVAGHLATPSSQFLICTMSTAIVPTSQVSCIEMIPEEQSVQHLTHSKPTINGNSEEDK